jgi:uncharacterized protein (TIGR03089 family)
VPTDTPERLFAQLVGAQPSRPFVTHYDEASGERTELSVKSLANWVAKTHHLFGDELGLGVGDTAAMDLPAHWISVPILLGALSAGLTLTTDIATADAAFVRADALPADLPPDSFAVVPAAAALGLRDAAPADVRDYVTAVRPQADAWAGVRMPAGPGDRCIDAHTRAAVVERARAAADAAGLADGGRLLTAHEWAGADDWIASLFAVLAVGGSLVIVRNCTDDAVLERRYLQERATARS